MEIATDQAHLVEFLDATQIQGIGELKDFYDLDGDGSIEIEATYDMPGLSECGWACEPGMASLRFIQYPPSTVWGWRDEAWEEISEDVPLFYKKVRLPALGARRLSLEEAQGESESEFRAVAGCLLECLEMVEERAGKLAEGP